MRAGLGREELHVELLALLRLQHPPSLLVRHGRNLVAVVLGLVLFSFCGLSVGHDLFVTLGLRNLILRQRSPDGELGDGSASGTLGWTALNRVDQRRREWFLIRVRPFWLGNDLLDILAEEEEVILNVLLTDDPRAVDDLARLWHLRCSNFVLTLFTCRSWLFTSA